MQIKFSENVPDQEQYFELFQTTGWDKTHTVTRDKLYDAVQHSWYIINAYLGERLVGSCRVLSDGFLHAFIVEMIVDPLFQRKNVGRRMMEKIMQRCENAGIHQIQLFSTPGKEKFYKKMGFETRPDNAPGMEYRGSRD